MSRSFVATRQAKTKPDKESERFVSTLHTYSVLQSMKEWKEKKIEHKSDWKKRNPPLFIASAVEHWHLSRSTTLHRVPEQRGRGSLKVWQYQRPPISHPIQTWQSWPSTPTPESTRSAWAEAPIGLQSSVEMKTTQEKMSLNHPKKTLFLCVLTLMRGLPAASSIYGQSVSPELNWLYRKWTFCSLNWLLTHLVSGQAVVVATDGGNGFVLLLGLLIAHFWLQTDKKKNTTTTTGRYNFKVCQC